MNSEELTDDEFIKEHKRRRRCELAARKSEQLKKIPNPYRNSIIKAQHAMSSFTPDRRYAGMMFDVYEGIKGYERLQDLLLKDVTFFKIFTLSLMRICPKQFEIRTDEKKLIIHLSADIKETDIGNNVKVVSA